MKLRSTTPVSISFVSQATLVAMSVLLAGASILTINSRVSARDYEAEIRAKQQEANQYHTEATRLGSMADSLQGELDKLNGQIAVIQSQISDSQKKIADLNQKIAKTQKNIKSNRKIMGQILADMHVDDQISPLEMLASSNSIGDYVDKQEQRAALKTSLNSKIKEIKRLQKKLEGSKKSVEETLSNQKQQENALASKQSEKTKLITETRNDQNSYAQLVKTRNAEIGSLREQQKKSNCEALDGIWSGGSCISRSSGGNGAIPPPSSGNGGYPAVWANAPMDSLVDSWGMYNRECVSYVAYKIHASGRHMPYWGGRGNANQWPGNAQAAGIPTGSTPRAGAAAVSYGGPYGHIMYVEAVNGDGTITVSDYNLGVDGLYRHYSRSASGLTYIYF